MKVKLDVWLSNPELMLKEGKEQSLSFEASPAGSEFFTRFHTERGAKLITTIDLDLSASRDEIIQSAGLRMDAEEKRLQEELSRVQSSKADLKIKAYEGAA